MRIIGIGPVSGHVTDRTSPLASPVQTASTAAHDGNGTALIPLQRLPLRTQPALHSGRPDAAFVTHLIATAAHEPQTRSLRRASPADALTRYRLTTGAATAPHGSATLSRTA